MLDAYQDALGYLFSRLDYEREGMPKTLADLRLGRMRRLLKRLGDPHRGLRIVHVAGTKGKGSTAAMMAAALTASGVRTGLYISPHLERLEERYQVDGRAIATDELVALVHEVREAVEAMEADESGSRRFGATFFEITTAMALLHFARRRAGAVVLEVGMGGRLDSTNVVRPLVAMVTSIALDHTRQLGDTLGAIAIEKAGIIKRATPAVSGVQEAESRDAIRRVAKARRAPLREIEVDFHCEAIGPVPPIDRPTPGRAAVRTWRNDWGVLDVPLLGPHQAHNMAVAIAGLDALADADPSLAVDREAVARGFAGLAWPARVEVMESSPWLVVDGAHNEASAIALAETLRAHFPPCPRTLVFGTTRDKDLGGQLRALLPLFTNRIATRYVHNPRAVPAEEVAATAEAIDGLPMIVAQDPAEALAAARGLTGPDGLICVTGSLFLAAEARAVVLGRAPAPVIGPTAR
ncbi:bifunctional folylpolyglutamate synthase/dihydrofolate synthase [Planctomyces sp. SH-PL62]|uniref:bifunctional folylpolyglutamate synthase/dihydrofolate synthase n=1 Tax=Planctomyces sp. SH-PL62 TaxID=1636152 RepID=UPI00078D9004|nr:folylpolyglutamate synthase/dihydrofolate synthase family protein [Planctomyces sp. SH-PL62]AMV38853.1 Folylpolyglutamate synthase [Planctomyces sp. SH-PL62]